MSKNSRKNKLNKKVSAKKEKYLKFETGKDDRIASRSRVPERLVDQTLVNENDENVVRQMRRLHATRFREKDKKR